MAIREEHDVRMYNYLQGELIDEATIQRSVPAECMQWHPVKRIAVIGWRSGEITVYNDHSREYHEDASQHRSALTVLRWNQSGTRIISGDQVHTMKFVHNKNINYIMSFELSNQSNLRLINSVSKREPYVIMNS